MAILSPVLILFSGIQQVTLSKVPSPGRKVTMRNASRGCTRGNAFPDWGLKLMILWLSFRMKRFFPGSAAKLI